MPAQGRQSAQPEHGGIAAACFVWVYLRGVGRKARIWCDHRHRTGHSYYGPAISPDGGFVAYVSDRSVNDELWLQQVGGGEAIQLTRSSDSAVEGTAFFPDGKRILYAVIRADQTKNTIEVISTLGGMPNVPI